MAGPRRLAVLAGTLVVLGWIASASAGELPKPEGPVILEIRGAIANTNGPGVARFDLAMLQALERRTIETATRWTEGVRRFEGVGGRALLAAVGASGTRAHAVALNDYESDIPLEDFAHDRLIVAYRIDGVTITVRELGPLWVMYDFDSDSALNTE
jgi:hypothetical protein